MSQLVIKNVQRRLICWISEIMGEKFRFIKATKNICSLLEMVSLTTESLPACKQESNMSFQANYSNPMSHSEIKTVIQRHFHLHCDVLAQEQQQQRLQGVLPESLIQVSLLRAQELVCGDSGSSYKHFRATKSLRRCIAEINGTSSHRALRHYWWDFGNKHPGVFQISSREGPITCSNT